MVLSLSTAARLKRQRHHGDVSLSESAGYLDDGGSPVQEDRLTVADEFAHSLADAFLCVDGHTLPDGVGRFLTTWQEADRTPVHTPQYALVRQVV